LAFYSASSLKQQSTGRYDDGRFVLDKNLTQRVCLVQSSHHHIYLWIVVSVSQHYENPSQCVCQCVVGFVLDNTLSLILILLAH
jgi:hypothetical protein